MRILLTGANGYIGMRPLPLLLEAGHEVHCLVRSPERFPHVHDAEHGLHVHRADLLEPLGEAALPRELDAAYYLVHSVSTRGGDFGALEERAARAFARYLEPTGARQLIYLGGLGDDGALSQHLASRRRVEHVLSEGGVPVTALGATFVLGGPEVLTYQEMLLRFARMRGLRRGRRHPRELRPGDALDFWQVLVASRERGRLLLYAEMRLLGEAWLEFELQRGEDGCCALRQTATFRPHRLAGRTGWPGAPTGWA